jgi:hypothetical protein
MGSIRLEPFKYICMEYRLVYAARPHLRGHTFARYRNFSHIRTLYLISLRVTSDVMNKAVKYIHDCDTLQTGTVRNVSPCLESQY